MTRERIETVAVIGTGAMGRGIMQWAAECGARVLAHDAAPGAAAAACDFVADLWARAVAKGRMTPEVRDGLMARLVPVDTIDALAPADLAVEAIIEDTAAKRALFAQLEAVVGPDCILATNTSSLSVTGCARDCARPQRVAGLHFFNPVPLMKVVEVIRAERTDPAVIDALVALIARSSHHAVICTDSPGFVVNHAGRGLYTEGLRVVQEGVAAPVDVDRVVRAAIGLPMGPFELFDLTGLDVSGRVLTEIYTAFLHEPRYRPAPFVARRVEAGLFGRKTGQGFYSYEANRRIDPPEPAAPTRTGTVHLALPDGALRDRLAARLAQGGVGLADAERADALLIAPFGQDATTAALGAGLDPARVVAIDLLFPHVLDDGGRVTLMGTPATTRAARDVVHGGLAAAGLAVTVIADSPGFVAQRVAASIVNTGCEIAQQAIARPLDIDAGVRGGLGYPVGPLALGDRIGPATVLAVLDAIHATTGDPRYRASLWLRRRSALGLPLTHEPEGQAQ